MSSDSSLSQALQPCLDSLLPDPHSPFSWTQIDDQKTGRRDNNASGLNSTGCWNLSKHLTNTSNNFRHIDYESEHSTSFLTTRSLEMCTEILGCETGSNIDPIMDKCLQITQERQHSTTIKLRKSREIYKKTKHMSSFPPPLTSISSGYGVKVQPQRGGGRLVITAFTTTSSSGRIHFKSERENGRLRLFLHKNYYYRRSEQEFAENLKENGGKIGCSFKCGEGSGSNKLTSLPICVAFS